MTQEQIKVINQMKHAGAGARRIAKATGIPFETVKSYLRRHRDSPEDENHCRYCGAPIQSTPKCRPKKYCSDKCRLAWWKEHPERLNRKALYPKICVFCGQAFMAYGHINQKYCSRICSNEARKKKPNMDIKTTPYSTQWQKLSYEGKNHQLYLSQKALLAMFLEHGAISREQHDRRLHDLRDKMGENE